MKTDFRFGLLLLCFLLSGFAALIYQTAWTRQFSFVFGTSELAVATVLAAYMGGLAVGALAVARLARRVTRPVLVYGLLEVGVAGTALAVPTALGRATALYVELFGSSDPSSSEMGHALYYLLSSFAILLVPTALMGATLPLLVRHAVRTELEIGPRVGALYAINTTGAVVGTLLAGFVLLPMLGLERTVWIGVAANVAVFAAAVALSRGERGGTVLVPDAAGAPPAVASRARFDWILPLILISGAVSFTYEVLWTRLLGHLLGGGVYAFATMLASFLAGIALGSALGARWASTPSRALRSFAWVQVGTGLLSVLAFQIVQAMPGFLVDLETAVPLRLAADATVAVLTLLPSTICIGATFPLAVRALAVDRDEAGRASARVFAWNTLGAIVGAVGTGFVLLPAVGYVTTLVVGVALNLSIAVGAIGLRPRGRLRVAAIPVLALALLALLPLEPPWSLLRASPQGHVVPGPIAYYGVGRNATVLLVEQEGGWRLRTNGLPEALIAPPGGGFGGSSVTGWLGALPSVSRPGARSLLVVGLGGGVALERIPSSIESIDVVELEREVIMANRSIAAERDIDPLADPRVRIIPGDARGALQLANRRYDAIVSQPSHPWTAGASHLYTREFFELVRERLAPDGVLVQWMGLQFVDEPLLRSLVATLCEVFPHVRIYRPASGGLLFAASGAPLATDAAAARVLAAAPEDFAPVGLMRIEDLVAARIVDESGARSFGEGAPLNTDDRNLLAARSPAIARGGSGARQPADAFAHLDPLASTDPGLDRVYLVRRLLAMGLPGRAQRTAEKMEEPAGRAASLALVAAASGQRRTARRLFERALALDPRHEEARAGLLLLERASRADDDPQLASPLEPVGFELALAEAWRAERTGSWQALRPLDAALADLPLAHPLAAEAGRLRATWRVESGESQRSLEAVAILDRVTSLRSHPEDFLLRARAARIAGLANGAYSSLSAAARSLRQTPEHRPIARDALGLLAEIAPQLGASDEIEQLRTNLRAALQ